MVEAGEEIIIEMNIREPQSLLKQTKADTRKPLKGTQNAEAQS
jgi:hypothetical protein